VSPHASFLTKRAPWPEPVAAAPSGYEQRRIAQLLNGLALIARKAAGYRVNQQPRELEDSDGEAA
jgi:hypothetical protein